MPSETIVVSRETSLMGTAGGLALARERGLLGSEGPVLVLNGDSLYGLTLEPLIERCVSADDLVSLGLIPHPDPARWSRVLLDPAGRVTAIRRTTEPAHNEPEPCHYPGVMVVSREALDALPVGPGSTPARLWEPARAAGRLGGALLAGTWSEVGTPHDYLAAVRQRLAGRSEVDPTAVVDPSAQLHGSFVGERVQVNAGSTVTDSIVVCRARLGCDVSVHRSVLLGPVDIPDGELVEDTVRVADWP
jgi:NDP-sugar pyrophosphorylase family protein